jgi:hypothetical protein
MMVALDRDTKLYPHHVGGALYDFRSPVATVSSHPLDPRVQGLQNLSDESWMATEPDGVVHYVLPGRSVRLTDGIRIRFPHAEATVDE